MSTMPLETIAVDWDEYTQADQEVIRRTLRELHNRQPLLMLYLQVAEKDDLDDKEHQVLYYLGSFIVQVMLRASPSMPEVKIDLWEKTQGLNLKMIQYLSVEETAVNFLDSMDGVIDTNSQARLFRFVVETLMNDPYFQQNVRSENAWRLFLLLKIVLDCLSKAELMPVTFEEDRPAPDPESEAEYI